MPATRLRRWALLALAGSLRYSAGACLLYPPVVCSDGRGAAARPAGDHRRTLSEEVNPDNQPVAAS